MRIFSIIAHPRSNSFCHAISRQAQAALRECGHEVDHHDLYEEGFAPCLKSEEAYTVGDTLERAMSRAEDPVILRHREGIAQAEGLLVVHPNWWGKPPAILAGWMDRILVPGVAYRLETADGLPEGLLAVKRALIFNTSDTEAEREQRDLGDPLELIWGRCVLPYCGVERYERRVFRPVVDSSERTRTDWLSETDVLCRNMFSSAE